MIKATWLGFGGRRFLTDEEHQTYLRRPPVRYSARAFPAITGTDRCCVCGELATPDNPIQVAHRVPFTEGVRRWKLTPDWLDSAENLVLAHRSICNKAAELSGDDVERLIRE